MNQETRELIHEAEQNILTNIDFLIRVRVQDELKEIEKLSRN